MSRTGESEKHGIWLLSPLAWVLLAVLGLCSLYILGEQFAIILDVRLLHEEHRILFSQHRLADPELFADDYILRFLDSLYNPPLFYNLFNRFWVSVVGIPLRSYHHVLPAILYGITLLGYVLLGRKLGGGFGALITLVMAIGHTVILYSITSALGQGFAFPLLVWFLLALLNRNVLGMAILTVLAGGLYQPAAVICGALFAGYLLFAENPLKRSRTQLLRSMVLLACTGIPTLTLVLFSLQGSGEFGPLLQPFTETETYPENGLGGRHFPGIYNPSGYVFMRLAIQYRSIYAPLSLFLGFGTIALIVAGYYRFSKLSETRKLLRIVCLGTLILWVVISIFKPTLSYRFALYPLATLLPLLVPYGLARFSRLLQIPVVHIASATVLLSAILLAVLDSRSQEKIGYVDTVTPPFEALGEMVKTTPKSTLFAAWPGYKTIPDYFAYLYKRPLLVQHKTHYPRTAMYILGMRERMMDLIDAYLATDLVPLKRLHEKWGVDYLLVNQHHFLPDAKKLEYMVLFNERIDEIWEERKAKGFALAKPHPRATVFKQDHIVILKLADLF